jgi:hypothetical protein
MMNLDAIACRMVQAVRCGIGGSWSADTARKPEHGYMVAVRKHGLRCTFRPPFAIIRAWLDTVGPLSAVYYGLWQDGEGQWYLDVSINVASITAAVTLGRGEQQTAIWDVVQGKAISL